MMLNLFLLYQSINGQPERLLGAVTDPVDLSTLQTDADEMPPGGYLKTVVAVRGQDGLLYVIGNAKMITAIPEFDLPGFGTKEALVDASIAAMPAELKARLGLSDHKAHAELVAERRAEREARELAELAKQEEAVTP